MRNGKVVEKGARDIVMLRPQQAYTQELLVSVPELNPDWLASALNRKAARAMLKNTETPLAK